MPKSIVIAWYTIFKKVFRDTDSYIILKKYCNTESDIERSICYISDSNIILQY